MDLYEHFSHKLHELFETSSFFRAYMTAPEGYCALDDIDNEVENLHVYSGATRCCLIDDEYDDWVVKFDTCVYDDDPACERECCIYDAAKMCGLDQYFCAIKPIGTFTHTFYSFPAKYINDMSAEVYTDDDFYSYIENFPETENTPYTVSFQLYACQRAEQHCISYCSKEESKRVRCISSPLHSRDNRVAVAFVREYGWDEYMRFSEFGEEWEINDIHTNNIGFIDDKLVLLDYAGYHE